MKRFALLTFALATMALGNGGGARAGEGADLFQLREAQNFAAAHGRSTDQATNPVYLAYRSGDASTYAGHQINGENGVEYLGDPLRRIAVWDRRRGTVLGFAFRNRYGATLRGHLWAPMLPFTDPVTGAKTNGPMPAVVLVNGLTSPTELYRAEAQGLAEAGYVVLQFDPQGVGVSDSQPDPAYCDSNGAWKQPQEMGFQERGSCAGTGSFQEDLVAEAPAILAARQGGVVDFTQEQYFWGANYAFGALDSTKWLLSDANPWRAMVDETRIGIAGHSLGGFIALMTGNGDPLHRFRAAASWDTYGTLTGGVSPTVPTLIEQSEQETILGPRVIPPDPQGLHPTRAAQSAMNAACIPNGFVVLGSSTHNEWQYLGPEAAPFMGASRDGERVGLYYSLAWFDRYLKGATTAHVRGDEGAQGAHALARLDASAFDDSVDGSSIGTGAWDPVELRNVPYTIAGESVAAKLSFLYESSITSHPCVS